MAKRILKEKRNDLSVIQVEKISLSKNSQWIKIFIGQKNLILLHRNYISEILKNKKVG